MLKVRVLTGYRQLFGDLMPLEEFVKEYRKIYRLGQDLFLKYDPCQISEAGHSCTRGRADAGPNFCCEGCQHLSDKGCTVEALWCKLWTCIAASQSLAHMNFAVERFRLEMRARKLLRTGSWEGRNSLDHYIKQLYGQEALERWKTTSTSTTKASLKAVS